MKQIVMMLNCDGTVVEYNKLHKTHCLLLSELFIA